MDNGYSSGILMCTKLPTSMLSFHQTKRRFSNEVVKIFCSSVSERSQGVVSVSPEYRPESLMSAL